MDNTLLELLGFTNGESRVYIALLQLGRSSTGNIIKTAQVSNSRVYEILDRLNKKGIVSTSTINGVRYFEAKDPNTLQQYIEVEKQDLLQKEKEAQNIITQLHAIQTQTQEQEYSEIIQGIQGIKVILEKLLSETPKGEIITCLGATHESIQLMGGYFYDWHQRRIEKEVPFEIIYNHDAQQRAKKMSKLTHTKVKLLPKNMHTPAFVMTTKDYFAMMIFGKKPSCILIKSEEVTESNREFFNMLWKMSKIQN